MITATLDMIYIAPWYTGLDTATDCHQQVWVQHCSSGNTLLGQAPVWLSCIILFLLGGIVGAVGGIMGMVFRHRKLQKANYSVTDSLFGGTYQTAGSQVQPSRFCSRLLHCCQIEQLTSPCYRV